MKGARDEFLYGSLSPYKLLYKVLYSDLCRKATSNSSETFILYK